MSSSAACTVPSATLEGHEVQDYILILLYYSFMCTHGEAGRRLGFTHGVVASIFLSLDPEQISNYISFTRSSFVHVETVTLFSVPHVLPPAETSFYGEVCACVYV